jgi:hypothetical protein
MSIVLVEFGKFPFEHFAWKQALLYFNRVSTITNDHILTKACRFFKSLFGAQKITSMSIVLVEFGKFPFEHFAWKQALLYYNRVSIVTNDHILTKAWEAQLAMLATRKKCWAKSVKKWLLKNQP